tara:strand:- start:48 stop:554 length:507 start_codon:yes stop_codon:yes gene_type:complete
MKFLILLLFFIFSQQANSRETVQLISKFNVDSVKWVKIKGDSSVSGEVHLKLGSDNYKGCAGFNIELLPASKYANERIISTYGNIDQGQILMSQNPPKFIPDVKEYHEYLIKSECDSKSNYIFNAVPSGEYYLIAFVIWGKEPNQEGGGVMKKISVGKHQDLKVNVKL